MARSDFDLWYRDIQQAAGGRGNTLREQQLSRSDIPIIVDSCLAFITQYGKNPPDPTRTRPNLAPPVLAFITQYGKNRTDQTHPICP